MKSRLRSFLQTSIPPLISIFYAKEGVSRLFVQNFLSHSTEKFRWGTLRCIRKFRVAKNFYVSERGGGGYQVSWSKTFCHTVPKNFVTEHFCVSKEFRYRKVSSKGGGSFTVLSKFFLSHRTEKTSPGNHSVFQKISGREKNLWVRGGGGITIFRRSFCLTVPKTFVIRESSSF